ncbi:MAG TPA: DegT/DnrJ/EryC1/StrS family aminotransferase [Kofleriaceae bacterium]
MIPLVDLRPVTQLVTSNVAQRWTGVLERCEFVGGPAVQKLESELAGYVGTRTAVACANGTDALLLALQAAGVKSGSHVALPNLTFWATFEAVAQLGAVPVLIDMSPDDLQMDLGEFRRAHERYRFEHAILVHLFGWASSAITAFRTFCKTNAITLVEDAAQAIGVRLDGKPLLADATVATLSFYPAKVIGGCMDGGAVVGNDEALATTVRSLANHGRSTHYSYQHVGWNSRMGGLQAHYLLEVMRHADAIIDARRRLAMQYRERLGKIAAQHCRPPANVVENGYLNVLACSRAPDDYVAALKQRDIGTGRTYPETMDMQEPARGKFVAVGDLARSRDFVTRVLNLPLYYGLTDEAQTAVIEAAQAVLV